MSYYFKLPTFDDLNVKQRVAVLDEGAIALSGGPGTGKSVVSVWRHISNYQRGRSKSILLTYTKSLCYFLAQSIKSEANKQQDIVIKENVLRAFREVALANSWNVSIYDEIIIDEAQDLPEYELVKLQHPTERFDVILKPINQFSPPINNFNTNETYPLNNINYIVSRWRKGYLNYIKTGANVISYGADDNQIVFPERATSESKLKELFPNTNSHQLTQNFRNTYCILNFVKHALNYNINNHILDRLRQENLGIPPILKLIDNTNYQNEAILDIINDFNDGVTNIAILCFFQRDFQPIEHFLREKNIDFSKYSNMNANFPGIKNIHLTTFKSSKGLEFDVVILPEFNSYNRIISGPYKVTSKDYYVALTRAKRNLFLISDTEMNFNNSIVKVEKFPTVDLLPNEARDTNQNQEDDLPF